MRIKIYLLSLLFVTSSFAFTSNKFKEIVHPDLVLLKDIVTDKDFQSYFKRVKTEVYPVTLLYADKAYVLSDPKGAFKVIDSSSITDTSLLEITSYKFLKEDKVRIKINYSDRKMKFRAIKNGPCYWMVKIFLARKAGGLKAFKSDFYVSFK